MWRRAVFQGENPPDHILIYRGREGEIDLVSDTWAAPGWISALHLNDSANDVRIWTFRIWLDCPSWRKQMPILSPHQSAMKTQ